MPADRCLRRRSPMLGGNVDDGGFAQQRPATERTPGFCSDPMVEMKRAQGLLLKSRMKLDLIDGGRDPCLSDDSFEVIPIEIRYADRADPGRTRPEADSLLARGVKRQ